MSITDGQPRASTSSSDPRNPRNRNVGNAPTGRRGPSKNWKWLAVLALGPVCVAFTFVIANRIQQPNYNLKPPVPAGYRDVANPYYAFSIPKSWKENSAKSDQNGDAFYQGRSGSAGETTAITKTRPRTNALPQIIGLFFGPHYRVVRRQPTTIPHATFAQLDTLQAAGGKTATLYHGWVAGTQTEFWVIFTGSPATVSKMAATLIA